MRVRMKVAISGTRDGQPWPQRGGSIDLPDAEAQQLLASGLAEEDDGSDTDEENAATADTSEKAAGRRKPMTKQSTEK